MKDKTQIKIKLRKSSIIVMVEDFLSYREISIFHKKKRFVK